MEELLKQILEEIKGLRADLLELRRVEISNQKNIETRMMEKEQQARESISKLAESLPGPLGETLKSMVR